MLVRIWRFGTLVLASLALTMESAHLLEMPQKMRYSAEMYASVNATLYKYFAIVGGTYQIASIVMALVLVFIVRNRKPSFRWTVAGALCLCAAFGVWLMAVAPVNSMITEAWRTDPRSVPQLWMQVRDRWEFGHAAGFVVQLLGLSALIWSVLIDSNRRAWGRSSETGQGGTYDK